MTNKELQDSIIFQDSYYLVANKPAGVSAQDDHSDGKSFHKMLEKYVNKALFVVHRLDRPSSGVMMFTKKKREAARISELLRREDSRLSKKYVVAVQKAPEKNEGVLDHFLLHDKKQRKSIVVEEDAEGAKKATLAYKKLAAIDNYTLLEVDLQTGRFHQIRAQLGAIGSPVKGDVKYGARRGNKDRSVHLHSWKLGFPVEESGKDFVAAVPTGDPVWNAFQALVPELGENKNTKWKEERT